jgi:hypothetical protein
VFLGSIIFRVTSIHYSSNCRGRTLMCLWATGTLVYWSTSVFTLYCYKPVRHLSITCQSPCTFHGSRFQDQIDPGAKTPSPQFTCFIVSLCTVRSSLAKMNYVVTPCCICIDEDNVRATLTKPVNVPKLKNNRSLLVLSGKSVPARSHDPYEI